MTTLGSRWKLVATDGDFITESTKPIWVPSSSLIFHLDEARQIRFKMTALSGHSSAMIGLRLDGHDAAFMTTRVHESPFALPVYHSTVLEMVHMMSPGAHVIAATLAAIGKAVQSGPKEWSPRKTQAGMRTCILKSPDMPLVIEARVVA